MKTEYQDGFYISKATGDIVHITKTGTKELMEVNNETGQFTGMVTFGVYRLVSEVKGEPVAKENVLLKNIESLFEYIGD